MTVPLVCEKVVFTASINGTINSGLIKANVKKRTQYFIQFKKLLSGEIGALISFGVKLALQSLQVIRRISVLAEIGI